MGEQPFRAPRLMRICLVAAHASAAFTPLALLYLKAYLVQERIREAGDVRILEFAPADTAEQIARRVLEEEPGVVGFSCYVWNASTLLDAARRIKAQRPEICIVLGGPEVGPIARSVMERHAAVDCIVRSEGERPFAHIVQTIDAGGDLAQVEGICLRRNGGIEDTPDAPILPDLDLLASPMSIMEPDQKGRILCLETQRGCVFRCNFCFYNKDLSIRNRRFGMERIKGELRHWLQQDVAQIYLMDPVFNLHAARAKEICRFIAAHNRRRTPIHTEVWAEFIDEEMARLMQEANFRFLEVGLQTTDAAVLATVERRLKMAKFLEGIGHLRRHEIPFEVQLIHGLPGETPAGFRAALNFAASLQAPHLAVFPLMILPGTALWGKAKQLGIDFDPEAPYFVRSHRSMTAADIAHGRRVSDAVERIGNVWTLRLLARERDLGYAEMIDAWIAWAGDDPKADAVSEREKIRQFVLHVCASKGIPSTFYLASLQVEFGKRAGSAATATA